MQDNIQSQIKDALRAKDQVRLTTLRGVLAAFTNEAVVLGRTPQDKLTDPEAQTVIKRLVKQRKDSIDQFEQAGRTDLSENEKAELKILEEFLPPQMSEDQIREIVNDVLRQAQDNNDPILNNRGALIGVIIKRIAGQADGALVKKIVEEALS